MSHFTRIATKMVEVEPLVKALSDLGFQVRKNDVVRGWLGSRTEAEIVVDSGSRGYDLGFEKQGGAYALVADWYGIKNLNRASLVDRLVARYAYHATLTKLEAQGFSMVEETVDERGAARLVLRRMA
jgi:hypothetical protein